MEKIRNGVHHEQFQRQLVGVGASYTETRPNPSYADTITAPISIPDDSWFRPAKKKQGKIYVLIAARNEEKDVAKSITAMLAQTCQPERILVIVNNTTDRTAEVASSAGAETVTMLSNPHAKAGALNYGLQMILPDLSDDDYIFVMDADTQPVPVFLEEALKCTAANQGCVVSGRYACRAEHGYIGMLQRNEFARDGLRINRRQDSTHIVVGTSCLLPVRTLRHIHKARAAGQLPGRGYVYAVTSRTEDYELTLSLKQLGYKTMSPESCQAITDVMPTMSTLWHQRVRWWRGGFEDLATFGWTKITRPYIFRQLLMLVGIMAFMLYLVAVAWTLASGRSITFELAWLPITLLFVLDRIVEVRKAGKMAMIASGLLLPEMVYDLFLYGCYLHAAFKGVKTGYAARMGKDVSLNATSAWKET